MNVLKMAASGASSASGGAWDLTNASFQGSPTAWTSLLDQATNMFSVTFKSDGTKMYAASTTADAFFEYNLSTAWDVTTASYIQSFSIAGQSPSTVNIYLKDDGTSFYTLCNGTDAVHRYDMSTPWDVSTASYISSFSIGQGEGLPNGLDFKTDGTKMYVVGTTNDTVYEYNLSTAWDITTASYLQGFSVAAQTGGPYSVNFKPDGTKMFISGYIEYSLSTPWDVTTASYTATAPIFIGNGSAYFKPDGTQKFVMSGGVFANFVITNPLTSAWDITTLVSPYPTTNFYRIIEDNPTGIFFKPDGTAFYACQLIPGSVDAVNQYSVSTPWDISTSSFVQTFSVAAQETNPNGIFFKDDGTKMYVVGTTGDDVNEYSLSTAWDISTASYVQVFSVAGQTTGPTDLFFDSTGTKMFVCGPAVYEYTLSTGWDVSTASYVQTFSVASQDTSPVGIFFKPDGTKMFILGAQNNDVYEYSLSSGFDISTASYVRSFNISSYQRSLNSLSFKDDGLEMYVSSRGPFPSMFSYDL